MENKKPSLMDRLLGEEIVKETEEVKRKKIMKTMEMAQASDDKKQRNAHQKGKYFSQLGIMKKVILIASILGVFVVGGAGYVGVKQYQSNQTEKITKEQQIQELISFQQKALEITEQKIEELEKANEAAKIKQHAFEQEIISKQQKPVPQNIVISATEIQPYLTGVVSIQCQRSRGSGSLWKLDGEDRVLTNRHVLNRYNAEECRVTSIKTDGNSQGSYKVSSDQILSSSNEVDFTVANIKKSGSIFSNLFDDGIDKLNYSISSLRKCPGEMNVGSPVVVSGFPAFSEKNVEFLNGEQASIVLRSTTNGIISSLDTTVKNIGLGGNLQFANYFVSAKIDSGNSGGIAFSKDASGLCVLGVPTWLNLGNYDTQGIIQNINNLDLGAK